MTAANGDELWATYEDEDGMPPFVMDFEGGSGRFEDAVGVADVHWVVQPQFDEDGNWDFTVPWPRSATIDGVLSY